MLIALTQASELMDFLRKPHQIRERNAEFAGNSGVMENFDFARGYTLALFLLKSFTPGRSAEHGAFSLDLE